jgi:uncharacterized oxidoreductase
VAYNKREEMEPGLLIDHEGNQTNDPGVMWGNGPFGAILPFGLHKGGGLAVICDILSGALTGGMTATPETCQGPQGDIVNNMLSVIIDPSKLGGESIWRKDSQDFITWVKSAKPQPGVDQVLTPGEPERARRADRLAKGVPVDETTWGQLRDIARLVGLSDAEIGRLTGL